MSRVYHWNDPDFPKTPDLEIDPEDEVEQEGHVPISQMIQTMQAMGQRINTDRARWHSDLEEDLEDGDWVDPTIRPDYDFADAHEDSEYIKERLKDEERRSTGTEAGSQEARGDTPTESITGQEAGSSSGSESPVS